MRLQHYCWCYTITSWRCTSILCIIYICSHSFTPSIYNFVYISLSGWASPNNVQTHHMHVAKMGWWLLKNDPNVFGHLCAHRICVRLCVGVWFMLIYIVFLCTIFDDDSRNHCQGNILNLSYLDPPDSIMDKGRVRLCTPWRRVLGSISGVLTSVVVGICSVVSNVYVQLSGRIMDFVFCPYNKLLVLIPKYVFACLIKSLPRDFNF